MQERQQISYVRVPQVVCMLTWDEPYFVNNTIETLTVSLVSEAKPSAVHFILNNFGLLACQTLKALKIRVIMKT